MYRKYEGSLGHSTFRDILIALKPLRETERERERVSERVRQRVRERRERE